MSDGIVSENEVLDARGLTCPMPLLKAKQALTRLAAGEVLKVMATDAGSFRDFHSFVELSAHRMLKAEQLESVYYYWIEKDGKTLGQ